MNAEIKNLTELVLKLSREVARLKQGAVAPNAKYITKKEACLWIGCSMDSLRKKLGKEIAVCFPNAERCICVREIELYMRGKGKCFQESISARDRRG